MPEGYLPVRSYLTSPVDGLFLDIPQSPVSAINRAMEETPGSKADDLRMFIKANRRPSWE
jgi:hypothetical protein